MHEKKKNKENGFLKKPENGGIFMKKRVLSLLLCTAMTIGTLSGCGKDAGKDEGKTTEVLGNDAEDEMTEVKIWHDGDENIMQTIADCANEKLAEDNIKVTFEKKSGLTDQLQLYGNDESNGPDMYLYAHDSLGTFAEMGILAPITDVISEDVMADLLPMTVEAGNYKDTQYLMPVYYETLLFMYNKAKWEGDVPETTDELYDYMVAHTDVDAGTYALVNQHSTAYNQKFAALEADGDYNTVTALFNEGQAAAIIGGPWLVSGIKAAGIDLGIKSLADFKLPNGNGLAPYSGVQSIGVLKYAAENKKEAIAKVLETIASPEVGIALANKSNCAPANSKAYDDADVAANEMIMAMKATAETAQPMPNIPQMSVMWGPTEEFLAAVNKSGEDIDTAAETYQQEALDAIADMQ